MIRFRANRSGMTMVELLVAMLISVLILQAIVGFFVGQVRLVGEQESQRTARGAVRSAMHVFMAELRRLDSDGGVEAASSDAVTLRVPFAIGLVCESSTSSTTLSMLPVDSALFADATFSGYAWRSATGDYSYVVNPTGLSISGESVCDLASIQTLDGGRVATVGPGAGDAVTPGTPVMLYQRIRYEFQDGPDGARLVRTILDTGEEEVLVERFDSEKTRFRFYIDGSGVAQDAPPADPADIRGLEIVMEGLGDRPRSDGAVATAPLSPAVFFKN